MNEQYAKPLGFFSSLFAGIFTILFGLFLALDFELLYFGVCLLLSFAVLIMTVSLKYRVTPIKTVFVDCAIVFAIMYTLIVSTIYYTQISIVRSGALDATTLAIVSDVPGTLAFYLDMFGYCFLCLATLFMALAIDWSDKVLRILLFVHSSIFVPTFMVPFFPASDFGNQAAGGLNTGVLVLVSWCIVFAPICFLFARYFNNQQRQVLRAA